MKAVAKVKSKGRPRGMLRDWYRENLPKMKPTKTTDEVTEVTLYIPEVDGDVALDIPKGFVPIPPELTIGKTQANVGQTARNEIKSLGLKDRKFIVHEIASVLEKGRGKAKKTYEFSVFAVETV